MRDVLAGVTLASRNAALAAIVATTANNEYGKRGKLRKPFKSIAFADAGRVQSILAAAGFG
jgi:hypothetical protein